MTFTLIKKSVSNNVTNKRTIMTPYKTIYLFETEQLRYIYKEKKSTTDFILNKSNEKKRHWNNINILSSQLNYAHCTYQ